MTLAMLPSGAVADTWLKPTTRRYVFELTNDGERSGMSPEAGLSLFVRRDSPS